MIDTAGGAYSSLRGLYYRLKMTILTKPTFLKNVYFKQLVMKNMIILPKGMGVGGGQWNKKHNDNQCGQNSLSKA